MRSMRKRKRLWPRSGRASSSMRWRGITQRTKHEQVSFFLAIFPPVSSAVCADSFAAHTHDLLRGCSGLENKGLAGARVCEWSIRPGGEHHGKPKDCRGQDTAWLPHHHGRGTQIDHLDGSRVPREKENFLWPDESPMTIYGRFFFSSCLIPDASSLPVAPIPCLNASREARALPRSRRSNPRMSQLP